MGQSWMAQQNPQPLQVSPSGGFRSSAYPKIVDLLPQEKFRHFNLTSSFPSMWRRAAPLILGRQSD
jgi:hypothetical protein